MTFEVGDIVCLVGKNESGKTNVLGAIERLNPASGQSRPFDLTADFPRRRLNDIERELNEGADSPVVVEAAYELTDAERAEFESTFGVDTLTSQIERTRDYNDHGTWRFNSDEEAAVKHLSAGLEGSLADKVSGATTLKALVEALGDEDSSEATELREKVSEMGALRVAMANWFGAREPLYLYFGDYSVMPGRVSEVAQRWILDLPSLQSAVGGQREPDRRCQALLAEAAGLAGDGEPAADAAAVPVRARVCVDRRAVRQQALAGHGASLSAPVVTAQV